MRTWAKLGKANMKLFGLLVENVKVIDIKTDRDGFQLYRVTFQYVGRKEPNMKWTAWVYLADAPEIAGQTIACDAMLSALLTCHS